MANHLPPPKSKHLGPDSGRHKPKREPIISPRERDILSEHQLSLKSILVCAAALVMLVGFRYLPFEGIARFIVYIIPLICASAGVIARIIIRLSERDYYEEDVIIIIAAYLSYFLGHYIEATVVMLLYRLGELVCDFVVSRCRAKLDTITSYTTRKVNVLKNGRVFSVRPEQLRPGNILIVSPGEMIPFDGDVVEGISEIDSSLISGDSRPAPVSPGSRVLSGSVNLSRDIKLRIRRIYTKSTYAVISENLSDKNRKKSRPQLFVSRFSRIYTPLALISALLISIIPPLFDAQWNQWLSRGVVLLLVSIPCAMNVSVPITFLGGLLKASLSGIHIKDDHVFEALSRSETVVFDKTGTITDGKYTVTGVFPQGVSEENLIRAAAEAERHSKHPVARTIRQLCPLKPLQDEDSFEAEELHGKGISAFLNKHHIFVGNASLLEEHGIRYNVPSRPGAAIHVAVDGAYWGYILVSDRVKSGAFDALEAMRREGVRNMVLLTGDVRSVSRTLASSLNFDMVKSELVPESKVSAVEYLMATKGDRSTLDFVGDAENDREALSRADIGIALGALTARRPFENADVVIMSEDLGKLPEMLKISRLGTQIAALNITVSLIAKLCIIALGCFGLIPIWLAAAAESGVMIFSMLNTGRIIKSDKKEKTE